MANQLRLDVAQLTDVGRKREHNEDNMAYVIPKDPQVMTKKGALFIVADGMGGHAAGEVASEIAVDTVSNAYYQDDSDDVAGSLLRAIRRANAAIHQRAAENMLRSGMGTTCVAAILRGNRAYIANVGDSRAYLLRNTAVKQISQDHSWVAEQVRAGLLTEDQARTHAQRNVITRCLGTQADVEIDVFSEELMEGDSLVLCTDGLSGLVSDEELQRIVNQYVPQESVYHLVERANENGGPDNITAIVVRVQEVGVEPPGVRYPVRVGGRETSSGEDTTTLSLLPSAPGDGANLAPTLRNGQAQADPPPMGSTTTRPLRIASGPLASPESQSARELATTPGAQVPYPSERVPIGKRNRLFYPSLVLLIVVVVALVSGGIYYFIHKSQDVEQLLQGVQDSITQAEKNLTVSPSNPVLALQQLAQAQDTLRKAQKNYQLSTAQNQQWSSLMMSLGTEVRAAIDAYNANALIKVLPCNGTMPTLISNGSVFTHIQSVASVQVGKTAPLLYVLGQDGNLYWLKGTTTYSLQSSMTLPATVHVVAVAGDGNQLFLLESTSSGYGVSLYKDPTGNLGKPTNTVALNPKFTQQTSKTPIPVITAANGRLYVLLKDTLANALLLTYSVSTNQVSPTPAQLSISGNFVGMAAVSNTLFLLLAGGAIESLQVAPTSQPLAVLAQQPIAAPLPNSDVPFDPLKTTISVPVPQNVAVPQQQHQPQFLTVAGATALSAADINGTAHLYISDPVNHRILDLTLGQQIASPNGVASTQSTPTGRAKTPSPTPRGTSTPAATTTNLTLQLFQQVVSSAYFNQMMGVAVDPRGTAVSVLVQVPNSSSNIDLISLSTGQQTNCMTQTAS